MGLLQFGEDSSLTLKVANDLRSRERAYRLLYTLYHQKGIAQPDATGMLYSIRNVVPETTTLCVDCEDQTIAVLTVYHDSPLGLPADEAYARELSAMRASDQRLCEFGAFGVSPEFLTHGEIVPRLFEASVLLALDIRRRTHAVVGCHPSHARLYCDLLEFEQVGSEGSLETRNGAPVVLLRKELGAIVRRHDSGVAAAAWQRGALARDPRAGDRRRRIVRELKSMLQPMSEGELRHFLVETAPILENAGDERFHYVQSRYPGYPLWHASLMAAECERDREER